MTAGAACIAIALVGPLAWAQEVTPPRQEVAASEQELIRVAALWPFVVDHCPKQGRAYPGGCVVTVAGKNVSEHVLSTLARDARVQPSQAGDFDIEHGATGALRRRLALIIDVTSLTRRSATKVYAQLAILAGGLSSSACDGVVLRDANGRWEMDRKSIRCTIS